MDKKTDIVKFSVILPCYNSEEYVEKALESITNQNYNNWEIISINDGSTDRTYEILTNYASKDKRIRVYSKENGGFVSAVNYGLEKVTGDYFLILGSDDKLDTSLFSVLSKNMYDKNMTITYPDIIAFRTMKLISNKIAPDECTLFNEKIDEKNIDISSFEKRYPTESLIFSSRDTSKCYKTSLLGDLRYIGKYGVDADGIFVMSFCHRCKSFMIVPCIGYYWTIRKGSVSSFDSYEKHLDKLNNWKEFFTYLYTMSDIVLTSSEEKYVFYEFELPKIIMRDKEFCLRDIKLIKDFLKSELKLSKKYQLNIPRNKMLFIYFLCFRCLF